MTRFGFLLAIAMSWIGAGQLRAADTPTPRPNIVWVVVDDMSANFSCYGEKQISTPNVDRLAKEGVKFERAFVTAPVCSACRSALITGCYQTTIGSHHHRSGRGVETITLQNGVVPVPKLFQQAGYYTCIGGFNAAGKRLGKTDYNFEWDRSIYDGNDWAGRKPGQPFFMQVQLHGGKYRGQGPNPAWQARIRQEFGSNTDPNQVTLPTVYPRDPVLLQDWADYLDCCRFTDREVGQLISRLEREGILDQTVIIFITDHGISHARGKQFLYDQGIHVPLVIRGPGLKPGSVRTDLVEHIDLAATSLGLAGIAIPKWMQGRNWFAADYTPKSAVFAARDRCDETMEHLRSVRTDRWKYIRNYLHQRPHLQPNHYKDDKAIVKRLRELHAANQLPELTERLLFAPTRPREELYDLQADPEELTNLADDPKSAAQLQAMRKLLSDWERESGDQGVKPESPSRYQSDMDVYRRESGPKHREILERNIEMNLKWVREGK
ncbi:sulfatase family protein [Tuwongella immobilis]|uniref:Sulfatase N-terminal domain-containing protein n=1 Tax=Tuwongella immobilis TaxID=692036 RepID=A0A6C2YQX3_9BACT|nr:sulfatase [Tuwongella immobilis]VIP03559.1 sulfatase : Sulfatase atsG OS=Rhodopirellula baltica SWK14 GN=RBSWK_00910 PE=4 SV=1: Sulfatase [Tuwongella immobilis]VTS04486.1 sulfatase : Sulfatase atsG OS=Rhodopirellula baltica SWK14 GN=RBSWK_00910 PE=4 SV=1: Sulfatase [Tuwongella immobilis]